MFTDDEEKRIVKFVTDRVNLGVGVDFHQLSCVLQELLLELSKGDKERHIPASWVKCYPESTFVRRFAERNNISLRRTMALSHARACLTVYDLKLWFSNIRERFFENPDFSEVWKNPRRIFNQDETALEMGSEHQIVLAPKGHTGPLYNTGGSSREHVTLSVTVGADGSVAGMRVVYSGKRRSKEEKELEETLPTDGVTGPWRFSKSPKGYVNRIIFLEILRDLKDYVEKENIEKPVILFIDGFSGHLGLSVAEFCSEFGIQLILLRSNMTHVLQPLDVKIFGPAKTAIRARNHHWHADNPTRPLNKRSLISEVVRPAFEEVFSRKETVTKAFQVTGLYPFNPLAPDYSKLQPGQKFEQPEKSPGEKFRELN